MNKNSNMSQYKKKGQDKMEKKVIALMLAALFCLSSMVSLTSCNNQAQQPDNSVATEATNTEFEERLKALEEGYQAVVTENATLKEKVSEQNSEIETLKEQNLRLESENVELLTAKEAAEAALEACNGDFSHLIDYYPLYVDDNGELCCGLIWAMEDALRGDDVNGYGYAATTKGDAVHVLSSYDMNDVYFAENQFMVAREGANIVMVFDGYNCISSLYSQTKSGTGLVAGNQTDVHGYSLKQTDKVGSLGWIAYKFTAAFVAVGEHVYILADAAYVPQQVAYVEPEVKTVTVEKIVEVPVIETVEKIVEVPVVETVEKIVEVPVVETVEKIVEVPVVVTVEKVVEVPVYVENETKHNSANNVDSEVVEQLFAGETAHNHFNNDGFEDVGNEERFVADEASEMIEQMLLTTSSSNHHSSVNANSTHHNGANCGDIDW